MADRYLVKNGEGTPAFVIEAQPPAVLDEQLAALRGLPERGPILDDLSQVGEAVIAACDGIFGKVERALAQSTPDEVEVEFAIGLSAEGGLPVFAKVSSEATFHFRATWKKA